MNKMNFETILIKATEDVYKKYGGNNFMIINPVEKPVPDNDYEIISISFFNSWISGFIYLKSSQKGAEHLAALIFKNNNEIDLEEEQTGNNEFFKLLLGMVKRYFNDKEAKIEFSAPRSLGFSDYVDEEKSEYYVNRYEIDLNFDNTISSIEIYTPGVCLDGFDINEK